MRTCSKCLICRKSTPKSSLWQSVFFTKPTKNPYFTGNKCKLSATKFKLSATRKRPFLAHHRCAGRALPYHFAQDSAVGDDRTKFVRKFNPGRLF